MGLNGRHLTCQTPLGFPVKFSESARMRTMKLARHPIGNSSSKHNPTSKGHLGPRVKLSISDARFSSGDYWNKQSAD
jgi:hypothetical protein